MTEGGFTIGERQRRSFQESAKHARVRPANQERGAGEETAMRAGRRQPSRRMRSERRRRFHTRTSPHLPPPSPLLSVCLRVLEAAHIAPRENARACPPPPPSALSRQSCLLARCRNGTLIRSSSRLLRSWRPRLPPLHWMPATCTPSNTTSALEGPRTLPAPSRHRAISNMPPWRPSPPPPSPRPQ